MPPAASGADPIERQPRYRCTFGTEEYSTVYDPALHVLLLRAAHRDAAREHGLEVVPRAVLRHRA